MSWKIIDIYEGWYPEGTLSWVFGNPVEVLWIEYEWVAADIWVDATYDDVYVEYTPEGCAPDKFVRREMKSLWETPYPFASGSGKVYVPEPSNLLGAMFGSHPVVTDTAHLLQAALKSSQMATIAKDLSQLDPAENRASDLNVPINVVRLPSDF